MKSFFRIKDEIMLVRRQMQYRWKIVIMDHRSIPHQIGKVMLQRKKVCGSYKNNSHEKKWKQSPHTTHTTLLDAEKGEMRVRKLRKELGH